MIRTEDFLVTMVLGQSHSLSFAPLYEVTLAGLNAPPYRGGHSKKLVLRVEPCNPEVPVRTLYFLGESPVFTGHRITAKIPVYEEKKRDEFDITNTEVLYLDRDWKSEEHAIEILLHPLGGLGTRTDRSADYDKFLVK